MLARWTLLVALTALGCATAAATAPDERDATQEHLHALEAYWRAFQQKQSVLQTRLPPVLEGFAGDDPRQWERAKAEIQRDPLLLNAVTPNRGTGPDAQESLLLWATDRGRRGERAREHLVFLGRAYAAAAGFDSPDPADWTRARELLQSLGGRGVDSAAIVLVLRLQPMDLPAGVMRRLQDELAALGPGALRVIRIALERANLNVVERLLPALAAMGEPAADLLIALCDHPREDVVRVALRGLAVAPHPKAVPRLLRFLEPSQTWIARGYALMALAETPSPEAGPAILRCCADPDPSVGKFAAKAAERAYAGTGDVDAVRALLGLAGRPGDDFREAREAARDGCRAVTGLRRGQTGDFERWLASHDGAGDAK